MSKANRVIPIKGPMASPHMNAATCELIEAARMWEVLVTFCLTPETKRLRKAVERYNSAILIESEQPVGKDGGR